ncbi:MAG: FG-GAP repeat protein [Candidatus Thiodiazotropha sp.]
MVLRLKATTWSGILVLLLLTLPACHRNHGDDDSPPGELSLSVSVSGIKRLRFTWNDVGADYYRLMANPDGSSGFTQVGENTSATYLDEVVAVHLTDWANASYFVQACQNDGSCEDSATVFVSDLELATIGQVVASIPFDPGNLPQPPVERNRFGASVGLSGDGRTLAVGDPNDNLAAAGINAPPGDGSEADATGAVSVYVNEQGEWQLEAYIKASDPVPGDHFGAGVALSRDGNLLVVSAPDKPSDPLPQEGEGTGEPLRGAGAVYVYRREGAVWTLEQIIRSMRPTQGSVIHLSERFGTALAVSGNGQVFCVQDWGGVLLYRRGDSGWEVMHSLEARSYVPGDIWLNGNLTLSDDGYTVAIGKSDGYSVEGEFGGVLVDSYVFNGTVENSYWTGPTRLGASISDSYDMFGNAVSLSRDGNTLAVGAAGEDSASLENGGDETDNSAESSGAVYLFERQGDEWHSVGYLKATNADAGDWFGYRVALSGDGQSLAVTALWESSLAQGINGDLADNSAEMPAGAVYLFTREGDAWLQRAYVKAPNTQGGYSYDLQPECQATGCRFNSHFGQSLAISDSGSTLVVSAPYENLVPTGAVYLY